jgi:hypothetical protein
VYPCHPTDNNTPSIPSYNKRQTPTLHAKKIASLLKRDIAFCRTDIIPSSYTRKPLSIVGEGLLSAVVVQAVKSLGKLAHEALVVAQVVTEQVADAHEVVGQVAAVAGLGLQVLDVDLVGLLDDELVTVLVVAGEVAEPGGDDEREAARGVVVGHDVLGDGGHDELGELAGAADTEAGDLVLEGGVAEAGHEGLAVLVEVDAGDGGEQGLDLLVHHLGDELVPGRVGEDLVDVLVAGEESEVGDGGVGGVEQTKLVHLELLDVVDLGDDLDADLLERRATVAELVLEHPLHEGLGDHRPGVLKTELIEKDSLVLVAGAGCDTVDHAVGEGTVLLNPLGDLGVLQLGEGDAHGAADATVLLHVVAGEDGERLEAGGVAADESLVDVAEESAGRSLALEVRGKVGMVGLELVCVLVVEVAALGDGHRDDLGVGVSHLGDDLLGVIGSENVLCDAANNVCFVALSTTLKTCVKVVLSSEDVTHGGIPLGHSNATDRPVAQFELGEDALNVDRQVGAVEATNTNVDDTVLYILAVVIASCDIVLCDFGKVLAGQLQRAGTGAVRHVKVVVLSRKVQESRLNRKLSVERMYERSNVGGREEETRADRPSKREHCYLSWPIQGMMQ